ncbi:MAG: hypothetical protein II194_07945 [Bacteroidales bacterium]|nr:hypothetical protein [Bacteroidales bacterium]
MKKIAYIMAAFMLFAAGCTEKPGPDTPDVNDKPVDSPVEEETLAEKMIGEWHCIISDIEADIYISLSENSFDLYQKIGDGAHRLYKGTWSIDEESRILTGKYNDGQSWGSAYEVTVSDDKNSMTLVPKESSVKEEHIYRREEIPSDIKENCVVEVKSEEEGKPVL